MKSLWRSLFFFVSLSMLSAVRGEPALARLDMPPMDIVISAGDSWWFGSWLPVDSPKSIAQSVEMWADLFKLKRIYWRGQQEELMIDYGLIRKDNLQYYEYFDIWERYLMKELHLNQVLSDEAHKHKMEVYLWAPLFDYGGPADNGGCKEYPYYGQLKLTLDHPEWMPVDRYGVRYQNGPIELAYPEARKALIEMYLFYLDRDHMDGITFFTYCENYGLRFEDEFGYNQPIVDEYKRRYGVDIRNQEFDRHLWRYLRGEYVTQFLRELKVALKQKGKKMGVRLNPREPHFTDRWNVPLYFLTSGRIYLDWEKWVREGIVDELIVSGTAPEELQNRTIENVLQAVRGTDITVSALSGRPHAERYKPYINQGLRIMFFGTDEASYIKQAYPEQSAEALSGEDVYASMRFLAQVVEGKATVPADRAVPLVKHDNVIVRRLALQALARIKDPKTVPVLEDALGDPERSVRSGAVFALLEIHGPQSIGKMIDAVKRTREFPLFEAVASTLVAIKPEFPEPLLQLAHEQDPLMRRLAADVLGRRGDVRGLPTLLACAQDTDRYVRFLAVHGLQVFGKNPDAEEALLKALNDPDVVVQDRAATSLTIGLVEGSTTEPRLGLESAIRILKTSTGPLRELTLNRTQKRGLQALVKKFTEFGDGSKRTDLEWGFRAVGNSILAFGSEGGKSLQQLIDQKKDKQLALLAWQVLYIRQGMENFCALPGAEEENAHIYATYPARSLPVKERPPGEKYDPTDK
jgi:HEAT repeat protein